MNRLIIIGNGFDLAHGLPTRYEDFLCYMLRNALLADDSPSLFSIKRNPPTLSISNEKDTIRKIDTIDGFNKYQTGLSHYFDNPTTNNVFLRELYQNRNNLNNWNDIEYFLFDRLKRLIKPTSKYDLTNLKLDDINKLNSEFDQIKTHFHDYLSDIVLGKIPNKINKNSLFNDIFNSRPVNKKPHQADNVYILNFNYTNTIHLYKDAFALYNNVQIIDIHGQLNSEKNPIIFGYGDERNDEYTLLENINRSEFLMWLKYFSYLRTANYKSLLNAIKIDFEVLIIGHSCGLSDRTLLSTILNKRECKHIRIYQYGQYGGYRSVLENISRHMDKSKLLSDVEQYNSEYECPSHNFK
ncbi:MAG: AbiH family protein [Marinoscillum sp.]